MRSFFIGLAFSVLYVSLYPILTGQFVIYHYPPWPRPLATTYVLIGILVQGWFCFSDRRPATPGRLAAQILAGCLYVAAMLALPGGIYQS